MILKQIVAMGGGVLLPDSERALERYILSCSGKMSPRVLFVPTASGDAAVTVSAFYETYAALDCHPSHLPFFRRTPADLRTSVLSSDVIHVGGGNTKSMLHVWEGWGLVAILQEAWERGIVLCGSSAGSICWFEEGVTDSVAGELTRLACLGFLKGSNCPHYDGEKERRPAYHRLVGAGDLGAGFAADDGVGLHFEGDTLRAVLSAREGAAAYRVERGDDGVVKETRLEPRLLLRTGAE